MPKLLDDECLNAVDAAGNRSLRSNEVTVELALVALDLTATVEDFTNVLLQWGTPTVRESVALYEVHRNGVKIADADPGNSGG